MNQMTDAHLDDPRFDRELRSEEAARELRDAAVMKRCMEILTSESEMVQLLTEYPNAVAGLIIPMVGNDYEDSVPTFRYWIKRLAEQIADEDTMSIDAFKQEI